MIDAVSLNAGWSESNKIITILFFFFASVSTT